MTELHDAFRDWLAAGARDEVPRDVALHAFGCDECRTSVSAFDALGHIDLGAAAQPIADEAQSRLWTVVSEAARPAGAVIGVVLITAAAIVAANGMRLSLGHGPVAAASQRGEVLAGVASPSPTPTTSADMSVEPTATATPTPTADSATTHPPMGGGPPPIATALPYPTPPPATPPPIQPPLATPTIAPTPTPTPVLTASSTPIATPLDDCADGVDNDGDLLIDAEDPGCAVDGNEDSA